MKYLLVFVLLINSFISWSQGGETSYFMSFEKNTKWLAKVGELDSLTQVKEIRKRLLSTKNIERNDSIQYAPLLVIDGILFDPTNHKAQDNLDKLFSDNNFQTLEFINSELDWTWCRPFQGVIIATLNDNLSKKERKEIYKK